MEGFGGRSHGGHSMVISAMQGVSSVQVVKCSGYLVSWTLI
uniref:Uncharacterized protein n=1 Tax=Arundo donax TaxID=35708 RepID=A0A0A8ZXB4_ARUDO